MTLTVKTPAFAPRPKRWTKREYNSLVDRGFFIGQRLYLYRGELIEMAPMGSPHARGIMNVTDWMYRIFRPKDCVRCQMPFETPGESMPEPDLALVSADQLLALPHPRQALLLVEVSDSSLEIDEEKAFDYAAAGVPEYWILDVAGRRLIVHREPVADASAALGFRYNSVETLAADAAIAPIARPTISVRIEEFLMGI